MTTPEHRRQATTTTLKALGLLAAAGMLLTGCVSVTFGAGDESAVPSTASAGGAVSQPAGQDATLAADRLDTDQLHADQLAEVALPADGTFPGGVATARQDQSAADAPLTMSLELTGFTPEGECKALFDEINGFRAPGATAVASSYEIDPSASFTAGETPTLQVLAATTREPMDVMGVYGRLPEACGTIESDHGPELTAEFAPVGDLDATTVTMATGDLGQVVAVGGKSVGRNHVYLFATMLSAEDAAEVFEAQADRFDEVLATAGAGE